MYTLCDGTVVFGVNRLRIEGVSRFPCKTGVLSLVNFSSSFKMPSLNLWLLYISFLTVTVHLM